MTSKLHVGEFRMCKEMLHTRVNLSVFEVRSESRKFPHGTGKFSGSANLPQGA